MTPNQCSSASPWCRSMVIGCLLALLVAAGALLWWSYFVPGIPSGEDQNAYHLCGRLIAEDGRFSRIPEDEFEFIGTMWVENDRREFLPKYPPGLPLLSAAAQRLGGSGAGFALSAAGALAAIPAVFWIGRFFLPPAFALLAAWLFGLTPMLAYLGLARNSHTPSLAFFLWGMVAFLSAVHSRSFRRSVPPALLAGLLTGACTAIRYTDFLLLAVPGIYILCYLRGRRFLCLGTAFGLGAAIPLGLLAWYHHAMFGSIFTTGYSLTGEDSAFQVNSILSNLRLYLPDIFRDGAGVAAVLTCVWLLRPGGVRWKRLAFWTVWLLPTLVLYLAYYWAPDGRSAGYMRFLLPLFPALCILGAGGLELLLRGRPKRVVLAAVITVLLLQAIWGIPGILQLCEVRSFDDRRMGRNVEFIKENLPPGSVLIGSTPFLHELDFQRRYRLYAYSLLYSDHINRIAGDTLEGGALWLQQARADELRRKLGSMSQNELDRFFVDRFRGMLEAGRRVYFFAPDNEAWRFKNHIGRFFDLKDHGRSPTEVEPWIFVEVSAGLKRFGRIGGRWNATSMQLWEITAVRDLADETGREVELQNDRNELVRQLGDEDGRYSQLLSRLEGVWGELGYLRWSREQRQTTGRADKKR
ncbi:MAG: ArnT family glycosyltransferase [Victivallaceae bacterium]